MEMNERIKELAESIGLSGPNFYISNQELERFAELIVKEMCDMMEQCQDDISSDEPSEVNWGYVSQLGDWIERFKKHFGVEE